MSTTTAPTPGNAALVVAAQQRLVRQAEAEADFYRQLAVTVDAAMTHVRASAAGAVAAIREARLSLELIAQNVTKELDALAFGIEDDLAHPVPLAQPPEPEGMEAFTGCSPTVREPAAKAVERIESQASEERGRQEESVYCDLLKRRNGVVASNFATLTQTTAATATADPEPAPPAEGEEEPSDPGPAQIPCDAPGPHEGGARAKTDAELAQPKARKRKR